MLTQRRRSVILVLREIYIYTYFEVYIYKFCTQTMGFFIGLRDFIIIKNTVSPQTARKSSSQTNATAGGLVPLLGTFFCSGSGPLARVPPLFGAAIGFRAVLILRY